MYRTCLINLSHGAHHLHALNEVACVQKGTLAGEVALKCSKAKQDALGGVGRGGQSTVSQSFLLVQCGGAPGGGGVGGTRREVRNSEFFGHWDYWKDIFKSPPI